jgi:regulatory protein
MREHSRHELREKLLRALGRDARQDAASARDPCAARSTASPVEPDDRDTIETRVDKLLDALTAAGHLDEQRFVESRMRTRAPRFGDRRIQAEMRQHGLEATSAAVTSLVGSERQRAHRVWMRKYGPEVSTDRLEQARQARFLAARGFSPGTIAAVVLGNTPDRGQEDD